VAILIKDTSKKANKMLLKAQALKTMPFTCANNVANFTFKSPRCCKDLHI